MLFPRGYMSLQQALELMPSDAATPEQFEWKIAVLGGALASGAIKGYGIVEASDQPDDLKQKGTIRLIRAKTWRSNDADKAFRDTSHAYLIPQDGLFLVPALKTALFNGWMDTRPCDVTSPKSGHLDAHVRANSEGVDIVGGPNGAVAHGTAGGRPDAVRAWMEGYAAGFKANNKTVKREDAIRAAVEKYQCTTRAAEAAFQALPHPDLRNPPRTPK